MMLTKTNKTNYTKLRRLSALPVLAVSLLLLSFSIKERHALSAAANTVIIVDAGHGGTDEGGTGINGVKEKDLTLNLSRELARLAPEYGIAVLLTRDGDNYPDLDARVKFAAGANASLFVSVHVNKDIDGQTAHHGYEIAVCAQNARYMDSKALAAAITGRLVTAGIAPVMVEKRLKVLRDNSLPAVLIECGNIDNAADVATLQDGRKLEELCRQMLEGIALYSNSGKGQHK